MNKVLVFRRGPISLELLSNLSLANDTEFKAMTKVLVLNMTVDARVRIGSRPIIQRLPLPVTASSVHKLVEAKFQVWFLAASKLV